MGQKLRDCDDVFGARGRPWKKCVVLDLELRFMAEQVQIGRYLDVHRPRCGSSSQTTGVADHRINLASVRGQELIFGDRVYEGELIDIVKLVDFVQISADSATQHEKWCAVHVGFCDPGKRMCESRPRHYVDAAEI